MATKDIEAVSKVAIVKAEINRELNDGETLKSLLDTTFKGLDASAMKRALLEGMLRGFSFQDFLEKNVYAIPFAGSYSLVTSIDHARKIAQRSGIIGSPKQEWQLDDKGVPVTATATVQKKIGDTIGDFSATVFFVEFNTGKNQWKEKPRHMIGKVAEMHALRKAFPEELAKSYVEEEYQKQEPVRAHAIDVTRYENLLHECKSTESLEIVWADMPGDAKSALKKVFEEMRAILIEEGKPID